MREVNKKIIKDWFCVELRHGSCVAILKFKTREEMNKQYEISLNHMAMETK